MKTSLLLIIFSAINILTTRALAGPVDIFTLSQDYQAVPKAGLAQPANNPGLKVFVSFSMPPELLRVWLTQASQLGAPLVLRGFDNNSFQKTAKDYLVVRGESHLPGMLIDPTAFERYQITAVPAVVLEDSAGESDILYGNIALDSALETFSQKGSTQGIRDRASALLAEERGLSA